MKRLKIYICCAIFGTHLGWPNSANPIASTTVNFEQKVGAKIADAGLLSDEDGAQRPLAKYFGGKAGVLTLFYSQCPNLCDLTINGLIKAMREVPQKLAGNTSLVFLSIDPNETLEALRARKRTFLARYGSAHEGNVHFLRGQPSVIGDIARTVGFHYVYDAKQKQFLHPSGVVLINNQLQVSQYFFGIAFDGGELANGLRIAGRSELANLARSFLLACATYDPTNAGVGAYVMPTLRIGALLLLLFAASLYYFKLWRGRSRSENNA